MICKQPISRLDHARFDLMESFFSVNYYLSISAAAKTHQQYCANILDNRYSYLPLQVHFTESPENYPIIHCVAFGVCCKIISLFLITSVVTHGANITNPLRKLIGRSFQQRKTNIQVSLRYMHNTKVDLRRAQITFK